MEYQKNRQPMAADLPDLPARMSAAGVTVEQLDEMLKVVSQGRITDANVRVLAPNQPRNIETKEQNNGR